jgi:hypothetical protein
VALTAGAYCVCLSDEATFATNGATVEMVSMVEEMAPGCLIACSCGFPTMKDVVRPRHMGKDWTVRVLKVEVEYYCRCQAAGIRDCESTAVERRRGRVQEDSGGEGYRVKAEIVAKVDLIDTSRTEVDIECRGDNSRMMPCADCRRDLRAEAEVAELGTRHNLQ